MQERLGFTQSEAYLPRTSVNQAILLPSNEPYLNKYV